MPNGISSGLRFPKKWGGQGLDWVAETAVLEEIGLLPMSLGCLYSLPSICGEALDKFGTEVQKEKYLKADAGREKIHGRGTY